MTATMGHNSQAVVQDEPATRFAKDHDSLDEGIMIDPSETPKPGALVGDNSRERLKSIIERIERVEESIKEAQDDRKDIYGEAKSGGYDVKALRTIVRMRKQDANERAEAEAILETYLQAMGMI